MGAGIEFDIVNRAAIPGFICVVERGVKVESSRIQVQVKPRASKNVVEGWYDGSLIVRLTAPPVEGAANRLLIKLLADKLGVSRSSIRIVSGERSRKKVLEVSGLSAVEIVKVMK